MAFVPPRLIVNFKTYPEALGWRAVALAKEATRVELEFGVPVAICPQAADWRSCIEAGARVYAQHVDRLDRPESTGAQSLEALVDAGLEGTLLNHSERRLEPKAIKGHVGYVLKSKRRVVLCTRDSRESGALARLAPTLIAIEPPELIGGDVSVTTADPGVVRRSVEAVRRAMPRLPVLCGAGVKTGADVRKATELGAYGILVASGVTRAKEPGAALKDLANGFR